MLKKLDSDFSVENWNYENNICPNCGTQLEKKINSSKKCTYCKKQIIKHSIYLNNKSYLLNSDNIEKLLEFKKIQDTIKDINFYEQLVRGLNYNEPIKEMVEDKFLETPLENYSYALWQVLSNLFLKSQKEAIKEYGRAVNSDDPLLASFDVERKFIYSLFYLRYELEILDHEEKWNVYISTLSSLTYHLISTEYMFRSLNDITGIDLETKLYECLCFFKPYIEKTGSTIEDIKKEFMMTAGSFFIEFISREDAWKIIEEFLRNNL